MLRAAMFSSYGSDSIATMSSIDVTSRTAPVVLWIGFALIDALPRASEASAPRPALRIMAPVQSLCVLAQVRVNLACRSGGAHLSMGGAMATLAA